MDKGLVAKTSATINTTVFKVWEALTKPEIITRYMFGTTVVSDWKVGSPIFWRGEWQGKSYEDKGQILKIEKEKLLQYSHFSPLSGLKDIPENYHTVTVQLLKDAGRTQITLLQDGNETEESRVHSEANWKMMLDDLKRLLEK